MSNNTMKDSTAQNQQKPNQTPNQGQTRNKSGSGDYTSGSQNQPNEQKRDKQGNR